MIHLQQVYRQYHWAAAVCRVRLVRRGKRIRVRSREIQGQGMAMVQTGSAQTV